MFNPVPLGGVAVKLTTNYLHNMKRACTILLRPEKIKKFISKSHKGLHHFKKFFTPDFRMKHASLCKGGGATLFAPKIKWKTNYENKTKKTIIKPKTGIKMKPNSIKSKDRPKPTLFSLLTSNFSLPHLCTYKLILPNKPNFQTTLSKLSAVMAGTYNEKKLLPTKKNKPKTHQKRTKIEKKRIKTSQNPGVFNSSKSIIRIRQ